MCAFIWHCTRGNRRHDVRHDTHAFLNEAHTNEGHCHPVQTASLCRPGLANNRTASLRSRLCHGADPKPSRKPMKAYFMYCFESYRQTLIYTSYLVERCSSAKERHGGVRSIRKGGVQRPLDQVGHHWRPDDKSVDNDMKRYARVNR